MRPSLFIFLSLAVASAQPADLAQEAQRARELVLEGKAEQAIPIYAEIARAAPGDAANLVNLAIAEFKARRFHDSAEHAQAALTLQPDLPGANLFLGASYAALGEHAKALEPLEKVLSRQPNDRNACTMLAEELLALERYDEAAGQFRKASELAPENPKAWYGLGRSYKALSEAAYGRLETTAPDSPYAMVLAADVFVQQRRYGDAFASYHRAQALAPGFPGIHEALAEVYQRTSHAEWAEVERRRQRGVPAPDCRTSVMACDFLAGRYREVVEAASRAPGPEALYWASKAYAELERAAFAHLEQLPASRESHIHAAQTHEKLGEYREAAGEWREALQLAPGDFDAGKGLAWALYRSIDCERALPVLTDLLKARPDSSELNFLYGANLLILQRPEQAVSYLETAVRLDPQFLPGRAALGQALLLVGRAKDAIPHLKAALADDEDASVRFQLLRAYQLTGQEDLAREALVDYQRAREAAVEAKRMAEAGRITAP